MRPLAGPRNLPRAIADRRFALAMMTPAILVIAVLIIYPIIEGIRLSLFDYNLMSRNRPFIGLGNFAALIQDTRFIGIIWNTVLFALISNGVSTGIGLLAALLLNKAGRFTGMLRALGYLPWITPAVVYVYIWSWAMSRSFSPFSQILMDLGLISSRLSFLGDTSISFLGLSLPVWSMLFVRIWASYPFKMTMLLAALQSIPTERYDAARVDGANALQQFRHIVIPGIMPVLLIVVSISTIWNLSHFEVNYLLTGGGPGDVTSVMPIFIYNRAFVHYRMGLASAAGLYVFALAAVVGLIYMWLVKGENR